MNERKVDVENNQTLLQVQPVYDKREEYAMLAKTEGLVYEVLELSMPPALNESGFFVKAFDWYKSSDRVESFHGAFIDINPASGDEHFAALSKQRMKKSCENAVALGAKNIVFHCSCFPFLRGAYIDNWAKAYGDFCLELLEFYNLNIFIENSFDVDPTPLKTLMNQIHSERLRVCLDVGHANYSRAPIEKWFDELNEYIGYLHISDNKGLFDDHISILEGSVDWKKISQLWNQLESKTPITLEINGLSNIKKAIDYLKVNSLFGL